MDLIFIFFKIHNLEFIMKKISFIVLFLLCSSIAFSQPNTITYQGKLLDNNSMPINQAAVPITFAIFNSESGGTKVWPPNFPYTTKTVDIIQGIYSVILGTSVGNDEAMTSDVFNNVNPWLEVTVNGSTLPRTVLTSVPFSIIANDLSDEGWASPGEIGAITPNSGQFTDLTIGSQDPTPNDAKLSVEGGIKYSGAGTSTSPGLLFYDSGQDGTFKYYDNNGLLKVLGEGDVSYNGTLWSNISGDYIANTDVISQGSIGVGFDMTAGYSFGFATIAMRENNTRILFEDTSVGAFPSHDWMLVANESSSGGQNYFAIENRTDSRIPFYVHSSASTNSLIVKDKSIGIGTDNPTLIVHTKNSNTPGIRLEQDNTGPYTPQTWDVAGNEANFFIRDVTGGSKLPFRIKPGAPTNSIYVRSNGFIGFSKIEPDYPLELASGAHVTEAGEWTNASDARLKTNVRNTPYGLVDVLKLNPVNYDMKTGNTHHVGFIAQEVRNIIPEVVSGTEGDLQKGETLGISYGNLVPVLTKAIQEQQAIIESLREELNDIKEELASSENFNKSMLEKFVQLSERLDKLAENKPKLTNNDDNNGR